MFLIAVKLQVQAEFLLMCGENAIDNINSKWLELLPGLLQLDGVEEVPSELSESFHYKAIKFLDKAFCGSGPTAKSGGAFSVYEVNHCSVKQIVSCIQHRLELTLTIS